MGKRLSSAQKMQRYRERLQRAGLVHVQGWVSPERAAIINHIISGKTLHPMNELISLMEKWEQLVKGRETKTRWEKANLLLKELGQVLEASED